MCTQCLLSGGAPVEKCKMGCGKPTFNGRPGESCSRSCRGPPRPIPEEATFPKGDPTPAAWILDPRPRSTFPKGERPPTGGHVGVIAFYFPDKEESWDAMCKAGFGGNFWNLGRDKLRVTAHAPSQAPKEHLFGNAEAAFQALKFWHRAEEFRNLTGGGAFRKKKELAGGEDWSYGGYGTNYKGMLAVLRPKFSPGSLMAQKLQETGCHFLMEHNAAKGRDTTWSDDSDGTGSNWLGLQMMLLRDELNKECTWTDFIKSQIDQDKGTQIDGVWQSTVLSATQELNKAIVAGAIQAQPPPPQTPEPVEDNRPPPTRTFNVCALQGCSNAAMGSTNYCSLGHIQAAEAQDEQDPAGTHMLESKFNFTMGDKVSVTDDAGWMDVASMVVGFTDDGVVVQRGGAAETETSDPAKLEITSYSDASAIFDPFAPAPTGTRTCHPLPRSFTMSMKAPKSEADKVAAEQVCARAGCSKPPDGASEFCSMECMEAEPAEPDQGAASCLKEGCSKPPIGVSLYCSMECMEATICAREGCGKPVSGAHADYCCIECVDADDMEGAALVSYN